MLTPALLESSFPERILLRVANYVCTREEQFYGVRRELRCKFAP